jgi:murein DD-endopeptidase MepM/ murein hydrolase activator NlpD
MSFKPVPLNRKSRIPLLAILVIIIAIGLVGGYLVYRYVFFTDSGSRWGQYSLFLQDPDSFDAFTLQAGQRCDGAPFAFPTTGVIFGLWDQSYRPGHRHSGIDIFAGTEPGVTPVYAAYPGYLTRQADWVSSVIIRIPSDPLQPGRQIWIYYTHMASKKGDSYIVDDFPPGTAEVYVEAGTLLGYQGNYSGDPTNPTGLHLHFSVVKDEGGVYMNELDIDNTYDPTPYFNIPVNQNYNNGTFPVCEDLVTYDGWGE